MERLRVYSLFFHSVDLTSAFSAPLQQISTCQNDGIDGPDVLEPLSDAIFLAEHGWESE